MVKKLAAVEKVDDEVQLLARLKGVMKLDNKRIRYFLQDLPLRLRILFLLISQNVLLLECFHGEVGTTVALLHKVDLAEGTATYDAAADCIVQGQHEEGAAATPSGRHVLEVSAGHLQTRANFRS